MLYIYQNILMTDTVQNPLTWLIMMILAFETECLPSIKKYWHASNNGERPVPGHLFAKIVLLIRFPVVALGMLGTMISGLIWLTKGS